MTSQFANYVPIQGLLGAEAPGVNPTESLSETVDVSTEGDANPTETLSESATVSTAGDASPSETMSESVTVIVT